MQLRTYRARDLATALNRARQELGPDALVLSTREVGGLLGLTMTEIVVGVERLPETPAAVTPTARPPVATAPAAARPTRSPARGTAAALPAPGAPRRTDGGNETDPALRRLAQEVERMTRHERNLNRSRPSTRASAGSAVKRSATSGKSDAASRVGSTDPPEISSNTTAATADGAVTGKNTRPSRKPADRSARRPAGTRRRRSSATTSSAGDDDATAKRRRVRSGDTKAPVRKGASRSKSKTTRPRTPDGRFAPRSRVQDTTDTGKPSAERPAVQAPVRTSKPAVLAPLDGGYDLTRHAARLLATATLPDVLRNAVGALVDDGLAHDLALRFARVAARDLERDGMPFVQAGEHAMRSLLSFREMPIDARALFVVGPPGAGKTTTVAKLAARCAMAPGRRVVLAQADGERLAALVETRYYAECLGVPTVPVDSPDDLRRVLDETGPDTTVLIDTAGVASGDRGRLNVLQALRDRAPEAEVLLLLPGGLHPGETQRVLARFTALAPSMLALSRVDDARRLGDLISAIAGGSVPLSFLTTGHRVPDDLEPATPAGLLARMLDPRSDSAGDALAARGNR